MATLKRKDRSPYWHGIYKLANGKFRSRSTKTTQKREARRIVNEWEVEEQKIRGVRVGWSVRPQTATDASQ